MIFVYSVIICLTCKRDFSQDFSKTQNVHQEFMMLEKDGHALSPEHDRVDVLGSFAIAK